MAERRDVAVWLHDESARVIVGAPSAATPSRWAVQGEIVEEVGAGLWLKANTVEEFRPGGGQVNWLFKSSQLFIPWHAIVTIQAFEGGAKEIGFRPTPAE